MKTFVSVLFVLLFSASLLAQSNASANATVTANLKKGLSISQVGGSLAFGEIILTGSAQTPAIVPEDGVTFRVIGHPAKDVTVTFSNVTLDNDAWVTANGGSNGTMTFTPEVEHTGENSTYIGATAVTSGSAYTLVNVSGNGNLYLWAGGEIAVGASQEHGDYTGTFTMSVAY